MSRTKGAIGEKVWREALMRAVKRRVNGKGSPKRIEFIADVCAKEAMNGEGWAIKEIGDRLDGKPVQGVDLGGEVALVRIERVIVDSGKRTWPAVEGRSAEEIEAVSRGVENVDKHEGEEHKELHRVWPIVVIDHEGD